MLTNEEVIKHNKHIIDVSGGDFGVLQRGDLDFIVDSSNQAKTIIDKATSLLYGIANSHSFLNGNKRTAFELSKGVLESGGYAFTASPESIIGFIGGIAQDQVSKPQVKEWITTNSHFTGSTLNLTSIVTENINKDKELLKKLD
ncbi:MAG: type II toxin-antitoxin system death-on-curing family toxin [Candidatus Nanoarchaeia archaeon]|nr:type II toxin-antitoxin system death-on-curing family toxin [Candidatus Nanoarchaeia archaeon]